jgi:hypothetical protein
MQTGDNMAKRITKRRINGQIYNLYKEFQNCTKANDYVKYKLDRDVYKQYRIKRGRYSCDLFVR